MSEDFKFSRQRILKKIAALRAKAVSTDSEAEAAALGATVARMLKEHRISMSEVEFDKIRKGVGITRVLVDPCEVGVERSTRVCEWFVVLSRLCADCYMCRIVVVKRTNSVLLVGYPDDLDLAKGMLLYLTMVAEKMSQAEYVRFFYACRDRGDVKLARGFRKSWLYGFCVRLSERFKAEDEELRSQVGPMALARIGGDVVRALDSWMVDNLDGLSRRSAGTITGSKPNLAGIVMGREAAERAPLKGDKKEVDA